MTRRNLRSRGLEQQPTPPRQNRRSAAVLLARVGQPLTYFTEPPA